MSARRCALFNLRCRLVCWVPGCPPGALQPGLGAAPGWTSAAVRCACAWPCAPCSLLRVPRALFPFSFFFLRKAACLCFSCSCMCGASLRRVLCLSVFPCLLAFPAFCGFTTCSRACFGRCVFALVVVRASWVRGTQWPSCLAPFRAPWSWQAARLCDVRHGPTCVRRVSPRLLSHVWQNLGSKVGPKFM